MKTALYALCLAIALTNISLAQRSSDVVQSEVLTQTNTSWDGSELPAYGQGEAQITILKITIPPKVKLPLHKHPVINAGVLLQGELVVMTEEGETLHLNAGDTIVEVVDKWHHGENQGDEAAVIIVFYAGIKDVSLSIKK